MMGNNGTYLIVLFWRLDKSVLKTVPGVFTVSTRSALAYYSSAILDKLIYFIETLSSSEMLMKINTSWPCENLPLGSMN